MCEIAAGNNINQINFISNLLQKINLNYKEVDCQIEYKTLKILIFFEL